MVALTQIAQRCTIDPSLGRRWLRSAETASDNNDLFDWISRRHRNMLCNFWAQPRPTAGGNGLHLGTQSVAWIGGRNLFDRFTASFREVQIVSFNTAKKSHSLRSGFFAFVPRSCHFSGVEVNGMTLGKLLGQSLKLFFDKPAANEWAVRLTQVPEMFYRCSQLDNSDNGNFKTVINDCPEKQSESFTYMLQAENNFGAIQKVGIDFFKALFTILIDCKFFFTCVEVNMRHSGFGSATGIDERHGVLLSMTGSQANETLKFQSA